VSLGSIRSECVLDVIRSLDWRYCVLGVCNLYDEGLRHGSAVLGLLASFDLVMGLVGRLKMFCVYSVVSVTHFFLVLLRIDV
jgi:hypothetical protein